MEAIYHQADLILICDHRSINNKIIVNVTVNRGLYSANLFKEQTISGDKKKKKTLKSMHLNYTRIFIKFVSDVNRLIQHVIFFVLLLGGNS